MKEKQRKRIWIWEITVKSISHITTDHNIHVTSFSHSLSSSSIPTSLKKFPKSLKKLVEQHLHIVLKNRICRGNKIHWPAKFINFSPHFYLCVERKLQQFLRMQTETPLDFCISFELFEAI